MGAQSIQEMGYRAKHLDRSGLSGLGPRPPGKTIGDLSGEIFADRVVSRTRLISGLTQQMDRLSEQCPLARR